MITPNPTSTSYDNNVVVLGESEFNDRSKVYFSGEDTYAVGTIMGQIQRAAGTAAADDDNTGTGTISAFALVTSSELQKIGTYTFTLTAALVGDLTDPDGIEIASAVALTQDDATVITAGGITFTITDATTAGTLFSAGDFFVLPVTVGAYSYAPYATDGIGGLEFASSVINSVVTKSAAGTVYAPVLQKGLVNEDQLIIDASGTAALTTVTDEIKNQLSSNGILVKKVTERTV